MWCTTRVYTRPLLFLLYIIDLANICKHTLPVLFADDTNLLNSGKDLTELQDIFNAELKTISTWLKIKKLSLNVKKTHYMVISNKKGPVPDISIYIEGHLIDKVSCTKFLGVFIDEKLNWKRHINYVSGKISRGIGVIMKARKSLNRDSLITLHLSFIYPYYANCNHV